MGRKTEQNDRLKAKGVSAMGRILLPFGLAVLVALLLFQGTANAAYHMVTPNGSGSLSGADWNNAMAGNSILNNGRLIRGDVYCIGGGTYNNWVLTQAASGTTVIELRAATPSDGSCGSAVAGWSATVDTTQNPAVVTKGSLQANTGSCMIYMQSSYWFINGVSRTGPKGAYNLILNNAWPNYVAYGICGSGLGYQNSGIHIAYLKFIGGGIHEMASETAAIAATSGTGSVATVTITPNCALGQRCMMPWFTNQFVTITNSGAYNCTACQITSVSGNSFSYLSAGTGNVVGGTVRGAATVNESQVYLVGASTSHTVGDELAYCYFVNSEGGPVQVQHADNALLHDNIFGANGGTAADHANKYNMDALTNVRIYRNVFEDCENTACVSSGVNHLSDTNVYVYDNVAMTHPGNPFHQVGVGNGFYSTTTTTGQNGLYIYNNTIINLSGSLTAQAGPVVVTSVAATNCFIRNNLVYGNSIGVVGSISQGCSEDHNSAIYVPTNTVWTAGTDVWATSNAAGNPFKNWQGFCSAPGGVVPTCTGEDYSLVAEPSQVANRLSLGAPYDVDFAGNAFTSTRGAFQYNGSAAASVAPPTGLFATVQ